MLAGNCSFFSFEFELSGDWLCKRKFNGLKQKLHLSEFDADTRLTIVDTLNRNVETLKILKCYAERKKVYYISESPYLEQLHNGSVVQLTQLPNTVHQYQAYQLPPTLYTQGC